MDYKVTTCGHMFSHTSSYLVCLFHYPNPNQDVFLEINGLSPQQLKNPVRRFFKKVAFQTQNNPMVTWGLFFTSMVVLYKVLPYEAFNDEI